MGVRRGVGAWTRCQLFVVLFLFSFSFLYCFFGGFFLVMCHLPGIPGMEAEVIKETPRLRA